MSYYSDNAFYKYIRENSITNFEYHSGDTWQLVYGNANAEPKLLVLVFAVKQERLLAPLNNDEKNAIQRMVEISRKSGLKFISFRFNEETSLLQDVAIFTKKGPKIYPIQSLKDFYAKYGLPINELITTKNINDKSSSPYQDWQRTHLGKDLKVIDLDLFKIYNEEIVAIYELKRSYYDVEKWNPYPQDYNNFRMLFNLGQLCKIPVYIAYNKRTKNPSNDDISKIMTLRISNNIPEFIERCYFEPEDFFK